MSEAARHIPVMLQEVLDALSPQADETYIDGTLGAGGYTRAILEAANCNVMAIDQDPLAHEMAASWAGDYGNRLTLVHGNFGEMYQIVSGMKSEPEGEPAMSVRSTASCKSQQTFTEATQKVHGIVLDIGVSSMQFDDAERGFSLSKDAPLDMRMSQSGQTAADFLNLASEEQIADVLYVFGEEHASRRIARAIIEARAEAPIKRTVQFAKIIHSAIGNKGKIDSATKSFQALRIYVNGELEALEKALQAAEQILAPGGRLVVVSFHSLEDRIVKQFLQKRAEAPSQSRHIMHVANDNFLPSFTYAKPKKAKASKEEIARNPRSRSAVLRAAIRTENPAMEGSC